MNRLIPLLAAVLSTCGTLAPAHEESAPFAEWMMSLKMPDHPLTSCCGTADQVYTDRYEPSVIDPDGFTAWVNGTRIEIPAAKVIWERVNPTGRGVLFLAHPMSEGTFVYCFVPSSGT